MERQMQPSSWAQAMKWWETNAYPRLERWWKAQDRRTQLAVGVIAIFTVASFLNLTMSGLGRLTAASRAIPAASSAPVLSAPPLFAESAPADAGRTWTVKGLWHSFGSHETEAFVVGDHWRVDWVYNPPADGGTLQVFVYHAESRLLMTIATNTQKSGADSTFFAGKGVYFLKVNSSGGDWKLDVQDLR